MSDPISVDTTKENLLQPVNNENATDLSGRTYSVRGSGFSATCWKIAKVATAVLGFQSVSSPKEKNISSHNMQKICLSGDSPTAPVASPYGLTPYGQVNAVMEELNYGIRESMGLSVPEYYQIPQDQCYDIAAKEEELQKHMRYIFPEDMSESFGNKHTNLVKMHKLVKTLERSDLEVPLPRGIASYQVQDFLEKRAPRVFEAWKEIGALWSHSPEEPEVQKLLQEIHQEIEKAFSSPDAYEELRLSEELDPWVEALQKEGKSLMVRSTGAEDSKKMANAGGNLSRTYVKPDKKEISKAVGDVVGSYFGASSLQNRLNAGVDPFSEELQLSVTLQELVGESIGGAQSPEEIPVSFVLFTGEPLYVGEEKFRVMRISATYGHGEAVVSNQGIGTDTVLALQSMEHPDQLFMLYDNKEKRERLAPIQKEDLVSLAKINNPEELIHAPALSDDKVVSLFTSGILMESFFKWGATDIEGVIQEGKVHFVQARPVNRQALLPTYLTPSTASKKTIKADVLVTGKASAFPIEDKGQVLVATTLEEAERKFKKGEHKLVVVAEPEPENSHPIVNFSGLGVPCLYTKKEVSSLLSKVGRETPLAVCMQTGNLHLWDTSVAKLEDHIKEGFAVHPAKIAISLPVHVPTASQAPSSLSQEIKDVVEEIRSAPKEAKLQALDRLIVSSEILSLKRAIDTLKRDHTSSKEIQERYEALKHLDHKIEQGFAELRKAIERAQPGERLQMLFHLKGVETLLFGSTESGVGQLSLAHVDRVVEEIGELKDYTASLSHPSRCSHLLVKGMQGSKEAYQSWKGFLRDLDTHVIDSTKLKKFEEFVGVLEVTKAFPFWLTFFQQQEIADPIQRLDVILAQTSASDFALLESLVHEQRFLEQQEGQIGRFADPHTHLVAWKELQRHLEYQTSPAFLEKLQNGSPMTKAIAYKVMERTVTVLDSACKAMKSSAQISDVDRVKQFKEMLGPYFTLMDTWVHALIPSNQLEIWNNNPAYFTGIGKILHGLSDSDVNQLLPSQDFSVSAAMIGSRVHLFARLLPKTLEDILTLLHQNVLAGLHTGNTYLLAESEIESSLLPKSLKRTMQEMKKPLGSRTIQRMGVEVSDSEITIYYNVPLRHHSGHLEIHCDKQTEKMYLKGQLFGELRERWAAIYGKISLLEESGVYVPIHPSSFSEHELLFTWEITSKKVIRALEEYSLMVEYSFLESNGNLWSMDKYLSAEGKEDLKKIASYLKENFNHPYVVRFFGVMARKGLLDTEFYETAFEIFNENKSSFSVRAKEERENLIFILQELIDKGYRISEIIQLAKGWMVSENKDFQKLSLEIFRALVAKGQEIDQALLAAEQGMKSEDFFIQYSVLGLFKEFIAKGHGIEQAIVAAERGIKSENFSLQRECLEIFKELVGRGCGIEQAIVAAEQGMKSGNDLVKEASLQLFKGIIRNGQRIDKIVLSIEEGIKSKNVLEQETSLQLFTELVVEGYGIEQAVMAAEEGFKSKDVSVQVRSLKLFKELVAKGYGIEQAILAAELGIKSDDTSVQEISLQLFKELVAKGHGMEQAVVAASLGTKRGVWPSVQEVCLQLFKELVVKGCGVEQAIVAAELGVEESWYLVEQNSLQLFKELVARGYGIDKAVVAAELAIQKDEDIGRWVALELIKELAVKGLITPKMVQMIREMVATTQNRSIKEKCQDILNNLPPSIEEGSR